MGWMNLSRALRLQYAVRHVEEIWLKSVLFWKEVNVCHTEIWLKSVLFWKEVNVCHTEQFFIKKQSKQKFCRKGKFYPGSNDLVFLEVHLKIKKITNSSFWR